MPRFFRLLRWLFGLTLLAGVLGVATLAVAWWLIEPRLPTGEQIRAIELQVPLKVYSADGKLMAIFGEAHRTPVDIADIPVRLRNAFLAIEDARFYEHPGIDMVGIARAAWLLATTSDRRVPGGSTITQQVARNFFLSSEYSVTRKLAEIFLALRMERQLSKDEILELYLNKIFFGYRSYGVAAASDFYYGKSLDQLTLADSAMLAAIPKFPSSGNPLSNPTRALQRRNYVLLRMRDEGYITPAEYTRSVRMPDQAAPHEPRLEMSAPYLAEMVRQEALAKLGDKALTAGYRVTTTVTSSLQRAADFAVRAGLEEYDRRHGYRGAEAHVDLDSPEAPTAATALDGRETVASLIPALVREAGRSEAKLQLADGSEVILPLKAVAWARPYLKANARGAAPGAVSQVLARGDIVRIQRNAEAEWRLGQIPAAQAALVALDPEDGAIRALVGGYQFNRSKFNRAVQSNRQPGSSFKPFLYSAALERGFTPASVVNDAPVEFPDPSRPGGVWRPQNDNGKFYGPMKLRQALVQSRNLVSVRLLDTIGVGYAREYITRFGLPLESLPNNMSLALGTASAAPLVMARGYAVFANGGYRIEPYVMADVYDSNGKAVYVANPPRVCRACPQRVAEGDRPPGSGDAQDLSVLLGDAPPPPPKDEPAAAASATGKGPVLATRVIDARNAYMMTSMMRDVIKRGTGRGALVLKRGDLSGKTGTTNDHRDGWFSGFNDRIVTTAWMGFDDFSPLGRGEYAASVALPIWVAFMRAALEDMPENPFEPPAGMTAVRVTAGAGVPASAGGVEEYFRNEDLARLSEARSADSESEDAEPGYDIF